VQGTCREREGNVKGTCRKGSGNIQGTCRERAGNLQLELRWTPVSPHPNCKKHLKEGAKVDAEFNFSTWIPNTRVHKTKRRIPKGVDLLTVVIVG
jgi:hypothetical protein